MKILLAAADLTPLISADPLVLAGAIPSLPVALQRAGHEVSVVGPLTAQLAGSPELKIKPTGVKIAVPLGSERLNVEVREARSPQGLQLFLLQEASVFGPRPEQAAAPRLDARAATLFSKSIVELARRLSPAPDIVQIQDWAGALAPVFMQSQHLPFTSVLAVADPAAQGSFSVDDFGLLNLGWEYFRPGAVEFFGRVNFLKTGILHATAVVAEGDLERAALQTPEDGGGLDMVFREHAGRLHGIPAGLDEQTWNPAKDDSIARKYRPAQLAGKDSCRAAFLAQAGLTKNPAGPVYLLDAGRNHHETALVDGLAAKLDQLLEDDLRLVVLGEFPHDSTAAVAFDIAARRHAAKLAIMRQVDARTRHQALAGSDYQIFLGRGLGLTARLLRSLKYGAVPILPAGPGLRQVIQDYDPSADTGCGLVFYEPGQAALFDVLAHRGPGLVQSPDRWESLRQHAMIQAGKFSWARTAASYVALYGHLGH
jgi:starch synthase